MELVRREIQEPHRSELIEALTSDREETPSGFYVETSLHDCASIWQHRRTGWFLTNKGRRLAQECALKDGKR